MRSPSSTPIIGQSPAIESLRQLVQAIAASSSTALVTGESGTGKELVAQALHVQGPRASGPFVPINCGAIPRELIESELFGHRKGTFTGAVSDRMGRFELANGGTLFLDEIGDLPMDMQVKLLRVLQERCILPVGASREVAIDVRVVAATHRNLEKEVEAGRFREDLYYRINVLPIATTPLRERAQDVVQLVHFYARKHVLPGNKPLSLGQDMQGLFEGYAWPGNVRELSNLVDRFSTLFPGQTVHAHMVPSSMLPSGMVALQAQVLSKQKGSRSEVPLSALLQARGVASVDEPSSATVSLPVSAPFTDDNDPMAYLLGMGEDAQAPTPAYMPTSSPMNEASNDEMNAVEEVILLAQGIQTLPPDGLSLKQHLVNVERSLIEQALSRTQGNVSRTAKLLQLQRTTLIEKINKYELRSAG
ncbi:MAG: sigma-54 interaction domain-containing protein [Limnohabitans sp.]